MEIFHMTISEFDELYKKSTTHLCKQTRALSDQYKDLVADENLPSFDASITRLFSSNKTFLHQKLKSGFSTKDYSYLIDKIEPEIVKINEEIVSMRKLYIPNEDILMTRNSLGAVSRTHSKIYTNNSNSSDMCVNSPDSLLKLPASKLVKLNTQDLEQKVRETKRYKVLNDLATRIQRAYRRYVFYVKPTRELAAKIVKLFFKMILTLANVQKIQKAFRQHQDNILKRSEDKMRNKAANRIQKKYKQHKKKLSLQKFRQIKKGLTILDQYSSHQQLSFAFKRLLSFSIVRLHVEARAYQVFKNQPHTYHLNNIDHVELQKIIPEEGKYKMSAVFWNFVVKSKVFYKWLLFAALRRKRAMRQSVN